MELGKAAGSGQVGTDIVVACSSHVESDVLGLVDEHSREGPIAALSGVITTQFDSILAEGSLKKYKGQNGENQDE